MTMGVYAVVNTESSKVYVGSTVNLEKRWSQHRTALRRGVHHNPHLQAAWEYYGATAFEYGILEYLEDPEELYLAEQFWVDIYQEENAGLYNTATIGPAPMLGRSHTSETKRKMGWARRNVSEETRRRLARASTGNTRALGYKHTDEARRRMSRMRKPLSKEHRCQLSKAHGKPYLAFIHRETGEIIPAGVNLKALCQRRGLTHQNMHSVKVGKRRHCKGWRLLEARDE